jgi:DNA mismatch repair protein MutS2
VGVGRDEGAVTSRELILVGSRIDEALDRLDRFLDAAQVAGHEEVRIVHGHGTGRLRAAVRRFLADHAAVRSHRAGRDHEGGDGATVATLG